MKCHQGQHGSSLRPPQEQTCRQRCSAARAHLLQSIGGGAESVGQGMSGSSTPKETPSGRQTSRSARMRFRRKPGVQSPRPVTATTGPGGWGKLTRRKAAAKEAPSAVTGTAAAQPTLPDLALKATDWKGQALEMEPLEALLDSFSSPATLQVQLVMWMARSFTARRGLLRVRLLDRMDGQALVGCSMPWLLCGLWHWRELTCLLLGGKCAVFYFLNLTEDSGCWHLQIWPGD